MNFSNIDIAVFAGYIISMMGFGIWISQKSKGGTETTQDYFLASKALPWWAVGGSLIASNISTEQILGMNGSGYAIGLAISSYELLAAVTLLIVAKYFLPIFLKEGVYTMPQFLQQRFDNRVRTLMAVFWVVLFIFVNITSILYLGSLAINSITGVPLWVGIIGLVLYSASFSIFGGLKAVVWTDVIQVVVLVIGGLVASYTILSVVGHGSMMDGFGELFAKAPEKFDMIFEKDITYVDITSGETKSAYDLLPGIGVLIGGMWIANLYYWGTNQYIIQRALAATSVQEAQKGVAFAAFLKLAMPLIVVVPGIATYVILQDPAAYGFEGAGISKPDEAFPWVLSNYVTVGFKGLVFAALVAAIGSSISSMVNSASTIFTLDIYKPLIKKDASEQHYVRTGKLTATAALIIGAIIAPALGNLEQVFQYIQEWTGFISPGVVAVFIFGFFWKRATADAAFYGIIGGFLLNLVLKFTYSDLPFLDRMGFVFLAVAAMIIGISLMSKKGTKRTEKESMTGKYALLVALMAMSIPAGFKGILENASGTIGFYFGILTLILSGAVVYAIFSEKTANDPNAIDTDDNLFGTSRTFNIITVLVVLILILIYYSLW